MYVSSPPCCKRPSELFGCSRGLPSMAPRFASPAPASPAPPRPCAPAPLVHCAMGPLRSGILSHASKHISRMSIRYTPIALWVRKCVLNKLDGWFHFKRPVGSLCIVPEEVSHQADVELCSVSRRVRGAGSANRRAALSRVRRSDLLCAAFLRKYFFHIKTPDLNPDD